MDGSDFNIWNANKFTSSTDSDALSASPSLTIDAKSQETPIGIDWWSWQSADDESQVNREAIRNVAIDSIFAGIDQFERLPKF